MVVDYNDADLVEEIEQDLHLNKTYSEREKINKICCFFLSIQNKIKNITKIF